MLERDIVNAAKSVAGSGFIRKLTTISAAVAARQPRRSAL
jgi:hypothetical protein